MLTPAPLPAAERERLLALIGVERWVLRGSDRRGNDLGPAHDGTPDREPVAPRPEPALRDHVAERSRPGPLRQAQAAIVTGEGDPLAGRHAALLRHVLRAVALDESAVSWHRSDGVPVIAFGSGDPADAVLAPPLATLRASAAARRALWPALRTLRRRLREGR